MKKIALISTLYALPLLAFAENTPGATGNSLQNLIRIVGNLINSLIPLLIAATLVVFFYGLFQYVFKSGTSGKNEGKGIMIAGLVALFIMISVWGIIRLAQNTLGIQSAQLNTGDLPTIPRVGN